MPILDTNGNIVEFIDVRHDISDVINPKRQFLDDIAAMKNPLIIIGKVRNYNFLQDIFTDNFLHLLENTIEKDIIKLIPEGLILAKVFPLRPGEFGFVSEKSNLEVEQIEYFLEKFKYQISKHTFEVEGKNLDIEFNFAFTTEKLNCLENLNLALIKGINTKGIMFANDMYSKMQKMPSLIWK